MGFTQLTGERQNIISDKGGQPISDIWLTRGGRGVWTPQFLAKLICEQPLKDNMTTALHQWAFNVHKALKG